jgi:hypothetical protein
MHIFYCVDEWNLEVKAWLELDLELLESVYQESIVLWNNDKEA